MKHVLLAMMAATAVATPVAAQQIEVSSLKPTSLQLRKAMNAMNADVLKKFPASDLKLTNEGKVSSRITRAGEDSLTVDPKVMSNSPGFDRELYRATLNGLQPGMTIKVASAYLSVNDRFVGNKITKIHTYMGPNMKDAKPFILNGQTGEVVWEGKKLQGIGSSTASTGRMIAFPCDYEIKGDFPIMVGYQMTLKSSMLELGMIPYPTQSGLLFDLGDGKGWFDLGAQNGGLAAYINCETEGEAGLKARDAQAAEVMGGRLKAGTDYQTSAAFINLGNEPIKSAVVSYEVDGKKVSHTLDSLNVPYLTGLSINIAATAPEAGARYLQKFTVETVNGGEDQYTKNNDNVIGNYLITSEKDFYRTAVMEQFTGTWCGWCPRGHVGMEKAQAALPNNFVGIAVHANDEMMSQSYVPLLNMTAGFPSAMINRMGYASLDPYYGSFVPEKGHIQPEGKGIIDNLRQVTQSIGEAYVGVSSELDEENNSISVTAMIKPGLTAKGDDYSVAYVLLEDSIKGYVQTNNFHSSTGAVASVDDLPEDLQFLYSVGNRGKYMPVYNNVARQIYDVAGIKGSLAGQEFQVGKTVMHNYDLSIPVNVANKDNLSVAVLLLDNATGEIITACKAKVGEFLWDENVAVESVKAEAAKVSVANGAVHVAGHGQVSLYSVDGKLIEQVQSNGAATLQPAQKGTYIVRVVSGNAITVKKVML